MNSQILTNLEPLPLDPIFQISKNFFADTSPEKVNLGIGIYRDSEGAPFVFPSIAKAAKEVQTKNFEYLSMQGSSDFLDHTAELFLGKEIFEKHKTKLAKQQSCGGTQACRLFGDLIKRDNINNPKIIIGTPMWGNYPGLFQNYDILEVSHLDENNNFNLEAYKKVMKENPQSVVLLQGGKTHNPTGLNASLKDLKILAETANEYENFLFIDFAYLGFGESIEEDRKYLTSIFEKTEKIAFSVSYSKNASLYRHRLGALFIKSESEEKKEIIESNLQNLVRESVSNMPMFASELMNIVFEKYAENWKLELATVLQNMKERKNKLINPLIKANPQKFSHLAQTQGMFGLLGLNPVQVQKLADDFHVYIPQDGRINFGGLIDHRIDYVVESILKV